MEDLAASHKFLFKPQLHIRIFPLAGRQWLICLVLVSTQTGNSGPQFYSTGKQVFIDIKHHKELYNYFNLYSTTKD